MDTNITSILILPLKSCSEVNYQVIDQGKSQVKSIMFKEERRAFSEQYHFLNT